jgi:hypothetical protein
MGADPYYFALWAYSKYYAFPPPYLPTDISIPTDSKKKVIKYYFDHTHI